MTDPGFPIGVGHRPVRGRGCRPLTLVLFVCENERIGSRRGREHAPGTPPRSANEIDTVLHVLPIASHNYCKTIPSIYGNGKQMKECDNTS